MASEDVKERNIQMSEAIRIACETNFGVLDSGFLCRSVSTLNPRAPLSISTDTPVASVLRALKDNKIGCVVIVDSRGAISGIFSERDCILKVIGSDKNLETTPISEFMTKDPVTESPDATLAFALNLMSHGGFRHLPLVDGDNHPIGIISVKDVVDYIVESYVSDLLNFPTEP